MVVTKEITTEIIKNSLDLAFSFRFRHRWEIVIYTDQPTGHRHLPELSDSSMSMNYVWTAHAKYFESEVLTLLPLRSSWHVDCVSEQEHTISNRLNKQRISFDEYFD